MLVQPASVVVAERRIAIPARIPFEVLEVQQFKRHARSLSLRVNAGAPLQMLLVGLRHVLRLRRVPAECAAAHVCPHRAIVNTGIART